MSRSVTALLTAATLLSLLPGCGYQSKELYPAQYRSVSPQIFSNLTFYRGVEYQLAEALTKELEARTPYKVTGEGLADTQLSGTIRSINQEQLIRRRRGNVPSEMEVLLTVDFTWQDLRSGRVLVDRRGYTVAGRYLPAREAGEPLEVGLRNAVAELAQQIVSSLRADWVPASGPGAQLATPEADQNQPADAPGGDRAVPGS